MFGRAVSFKVVKYGCIQLCRRVGMADEADSKSVVGNHVRVQVPLPAVFISAKSLGNVGFGIFHALNILITFDYFFISQLYAASQFPGLRWKLLRSCNPYQKRHMYNCYHLLFLCAQGLKMQQRLIPLRFLTLS